jgi:DNA polymerase-3 subunit alpha
MVAESIQSIYETRCSKLEKLRISVAKADIGNGWVNDFHNSLNDYKDGSCPVVLDYAHPKAAGQFTLGEQWRVQPKDELITRLKEQFGSTNVNLDYG